VLDEIRRLDWKSRKTEDKVKKLEKVYYELEEKLGRMPDEKEVAYELKISLEKFYKLLDETRAPQFVSISSDESGLIETIPAGESDILSEIENEELQVKLSEIIANLPERERVLITLYYYEELTLKEVGKVLGLKESRVCQLHSQVILHLRNALKKLV
jgi:RNA polymerase sigma factor for flagellar operon FliA